MREWIWVPLPVLHAIHDRQIARHGGAPGTRDATLLEGAAARPVNRAVYEAGTVFEVAAAYGFGIAKAHAFVDGNKRTAFVATLTFLRLNGFALRPDPTDGVQMMEDLASGARSEADFAVWLEHLARPIEG